MIFPEKQRSSRSVLVQIVLMSSFCALATVAATGPAAAQQSATQQTPTMSVQVNVVNVLATVRDKHGKIINDLNKEDFTLTEDGRPQTVRYFTRETDLPLSLGLLVDTSLSQRRVLDQERTASHSFLDQMVREDKDKALIIHFDREVELLQDFTPSHAKLEAALEQLQTPQLSQTSAGNSPDSYPGSGRGSGRHGGGAGTLLYDAVYLATDESDGLMSKQQGRKALIILSDGVDRGSKETLEGAIASAQRADTIVYSILFKDDESYGNQGGFGGPRIGMGGGGMGGPMGGPMGGGGMGRRGGGGYPSQREHPDGKKILEQISKQTGGRLFEVSKKQPIDSIYSQIEEELRNQYSLGYTPDRAGAAVEGYHKIQLTTGRKDAVVQTRDGYYAER
jgi:VWFA-related protein